VREGTVSDCVPGLLQPNSRSIVSVERKSYRGICGNSKNPYFL
jgi:hypothetical protein